MEQLINAAIKFGLGPIVIVVVLAVIILPQAVRILRGIRARRHFSGSANCKGRKAGIIFLIPMVDKMVRMDLRVVTIDVPKQEIMTKDNVPATVDAVMYSASWTRTQRW